MTSISTLAIIAVTAALAAFAAVVSVLFGLQAGSAMLAAPLLGLLSLGTGLAAATLALRGQ